MSEPELAVTENGRERGKRLRTQRIISAARQLIHERPNQPPTIPEVAARAGVAPMTIFNLIGNRDDLWAALADESLADWQNVASGVADPHKRAHKIVDEVMRIISEEAPVFRALISGWRDSGRVLERDPSKALVACLQQAADEGRIAAGLDVRRLGAMIFSGLVGIVHQWAAGLIGERAMRRRARDLVDIAFAAGRPDNTSPTWDLGSG